ncbi:cytochrome b/b6 domain-containing protein [Phenylobacterium deserti]|uniref:Ni/Fe-hydrogenase 1 b-type cytochrome subunit n=1 Tax=Phenylobacterium deserti TaxID=1914756 RepID=A0A328A8Q1_9CAUL|nr:cytochrome b/b6 domain-containing protein [Phenylobacterium deserti]RAK50697.1 Ni/Fe-hydrogenase 1 b-type cytochrome subunit [Phenylobacterium deserti]
MTQPQGTAAAVRARLWDGPTRIVHWGLVALLGFSWWSAENGQLTWHRWSGYAVLGLLLFRIVWGFVGSGSARFASFVRGPRAIAAYLRTLPSRSPTDVPGHNPLGALSVLAILALLAVQVVTGLFAVDLDGFEGGPLSDRVDFDTGRVIAGWHDLSFTALQVLVALHIAAVVLYAVYKRNNLIWPMITGRRAFGADPGLRFAPVWIALLAAAAAAAVAWWVSKGLRF